MHIHRQHFDCRLSLEHRFDIVVTLAGAIRDPHFIFNLQLGWVRFAIAVL